MWVVSLVLNEGMVGAVQASLQVWDHVEWGEGHSLFCLGNRQGVGPYQVGLYYLEWAWDQGHPEILAYWPLGAYPVEPWEEGEGWDEEVSLLLPSWV